MSEISIQQRKNEVIKMVGAAFAQKQIKLPEGYDRDLAIELAVPKLLALQDKNKQPALLTCDPKSIANALYLMCVKGYYVHKSHCAFIVYGTNVELQDQYQGRIMVARRDWGLKEIIAEVVYKGDELIIERDEFGRKSYRHKSGPFAERDTATANIVGAYCYLYWSDGTRTAHEMTFAQIKAAWMKGYGQGATHNQFGEKMAIKTCVTSALTMWGNTNPHIGIDDDESEVTYNVPYIVEAPESLPTAQRVELPAAQKIAPPVFEQAAKVQAQPVQTQQAESFDPAQEPDF